jgi:hypothetical protein
VPEPEIRSLPETTGPAEGLSDSGPARNLQDGPDGDNPGVYHDGRLKSQGAGKPKKYLSKKITVRNIIFLPDGKMTVLEIVSISLITGGFTAGLGYIFVRKLIESTIDFEFNKLNLQKAADLSVKVPVRQDFFKREMMLYPEIIILIYRLKNAARDCLDEKTRTRGQVQKFSSLNVCLTENLYEYRPFLPEDIFKDLHRYKIHIQEFGVLLDHVTRSTEVESFPVDPGTLSLAKEQIAGKYRIIEKCHADLNPKIKKICREKLDA